MSHSAPNTVRNRLSLTWRTVAAGAAGLALAVTLAVALLSPSPPEPSASQPVVAATPAVSRPHPLTASEAALLSAALSTSDPDQVRPVLAAETRQPFDEMKGTLIPAGTRLTIDPKTFASGVRDTGSVNATLRERGHRPSRWVLLLSWEDDSWHLLGTVAQ